MMRSMLIAVLAMFFAGSAAAQEDCDFNTTVDLATLVGNAISERLADGRLTGEDLNGPLGERVNLANGAFAENRLAEACARYREIAADYRFIADLELPAWLVSPAAQLAVQAGLAALDCPDPAWITDRSAEASDVTVQLGAPGTPPLHVEQPTRMLTLGCERDSFEVFVTIGFGGGEVPYLMPLFFWYGP
ncbi:MAG: hypothetical protein KIS68_03440 [Bauldia sp.]|nr:hypothetical protein [Bauldia sp.]